MSESHSAGARFRSALAAESPLQVVGAITAYAGLMAKRTGYKALYLSGGGVAANSLGMPDLGISTMEDVLTDARRIVEATQLPLLVDIDTGWGGAFNIARTIRSFERVGVEVGADELEARDEIAARPPGGELHPGGDEIVGIANCLQFLKALFTCELSQCIPISVTKSVARWTGWKLDNRHFHQGELRLAQCTEADERSVTKEAGTIGHQILIQIEGQG